MILSITRLALYHELTLSLCLLTELPQIAAFFAMLLTIISGAPHLTGVVIICALVPATAIHKFVTEEPVHEWMLAPVFRVVLMLVAVCSFVVCHVSVPLGVLLVLVTDFFAYKPDVWKIKSGLFVCMLASTMEAWHWTPWQEAAIVTACAWIAFGIMYKIQPVQTK
jgi:hypothetical protein